MTPTNELPRWMIVAIQTVVVLAVTVIIGAFAAALAIAALRLVI